MPDQTNDGSVVQGGAVQSVYIKNATMPSGDVAITSAPTEASAQQVQGTAAAGTAPVGNPLLLGGFNGSNVERVRVININKTVQATGVSNGADHIVWVPESGKKFRLRVLYARASIGGRYEMRDGPQVAIYFYLAANVWTNIVLLDENGHLSTGVNNILLFRNRSGLSSDIDVYAAGNEE